MLSGTAITSRTHRALPGLRVVAVIGYCDWYYLPVGTATRTTTTGRWQLSSTDHHSDWRLYWAQDRQGWPVNSVCASRKHVRATVTVHRASTSVPAGTDVAITGCIRSVDVPGSATLTLQRHYGAAWRTVLNRMLPGICSYHLTATPPRGYWHSRVRVLMKSPDVYGTTSPTFTLHGI